VRDAAVPRTNALDVEVIARISLNPTESALLILSLVEMHDVAIDFNLHEVVHVLSSSGLNQ